MRRFILIIAMLSVLFQACRKEPDPPEDPQELTDAMARDSLYFLMKQWYYWADLMPKVIKEDFSDPYDILEAMRYSELDKWSFIADYDLFNAEMEGEFVGHGIRLGVDDDMNARIAFIYKRSPLYRLGVRRGWTVRSINGYDIGRIISEGDDDAYNIAFGPLREGVTNSFDFIRPDGTDITIVSAKARFDVNSVLHYDTLHLSSGITGHLVFESFILPSPEELDTVFAFFDRCGISDLILDMRYNGGGYLHVAQKLASEMAGRPLSVSGSAFATIQYNNRNQRENYTYRFIEPGYDLSLTRLVVISTNATASASEAVINGLKPYMDVKIIGDNTSGKPVGMNGWPTGKKYWFWPITFKIINSMKEGDYFNGFVPDKRVADDITRDFSDRKELCLKEAIQYLENRTFSTKGTGDFSRHPQYSEKSSWWNQGLMLE